MDPRLWSRDPFELRLYPDLAIRVAAREVEHFDTGVPIEGPPESGSLVELTMVMAEVMTQFRGIGLAAPQIGVARQVVVFADKRTDEGQAGAFVLCNPKVTMREGEATAEEGCLSLPGLMVQVPRATSIKVEAVDAFGVPFDFVADGYEARVIQHEIDHLSGKLIVDYLPVPERVEALARFARAELRAREMAQARLAA